MGHDQPDREAWADSYRRLHVQLALTVFVHFLLTSALPSLTARAAAKLERHDQYEGFVEVLGRKLSNENTNEH